MAHGKPFLPVCALTPGKQFPSTRFRWRQYEPFLRSAGIEPTELHSPHGAYPPPSLGARLPWFAGSVWDAFGAVRQANRYAVRFLQREMISTLCSAEPFLNSPMVFDVDDATFLLQRFGGVDRIARHANLVVCGNDFLADHFSPFAKTTVLPTAVDTGHFVPTSQTPDRPLIGWSGSSSGFPYLYQIERALLTVLQKLPNVQLRVVADKAPEFKTISPDRLDFRRWSAETEVADIQALSIGIMPLADSPWERGKCSFKMLTYMAVGVPVVVSDVGMNVQIMKQGQPGLMARNHDEWVDALITLLSQASLSAKMGRQGRELVEQHYAADKIGMRLAALLKAQAR